MHNITTPVYIVDDDESVRDSLVFMLESYGFSVYPFEDGREFIEQVELSSAACVVLDSAMPQLRGQQVHAILNEVHSPIAVIFLTGHGDVPMAVDALKLGAVDFFQKPADGDRLAKAIEQACLKSELMAQEVTIMDAYDSLTAREQTILELIVAGKRNLAIADELCIAMRTVEIHRANLMRKMNSKTIANLVMLYCIIKHAI